MTVTNSRRARTAALGAVDRSVRDIVKEESGDAELVERPAYTGAQTMILAPTAEATVRAALLLRDAANARAHRAISEVRGEGGTWERVAELLGLPEEHDDGGSAAERAFDFVAPTVLFRSPTTSWRCTSCDRVVTDHGPWNHPSDNERGHASTCTRHNAEIAAYEAKWEDA
ncbi:MAG: hypothetical protein M3443_18625 [Actinomycetota bacterium]|nr:hypothetical protein [Actinomycetota bacterium]